MILGRAAGGRDLRGQVTPQEKEARLGQRGAAVWLSRELAEPLERALFEQGRTVVHFDATAWEKSLAGGEATVALAALLRSLAEQGILVLIGGDGAAPEGLRGPLGVRLVECVAKDVDAALAFLGSVAVGSSDAAGEGAGI